MPAIWPPSPTGFSVKPLVEIAYDLQHSEFAFNWEVLEGKQLSSGLSVAVWYLDELLNPVTVTGAGTGRRATSRWGSV